MYRNGWLELAGFDKIREDGYGELNVNPTDDEILNLCYGMLPDENGHRQNGPRFNLDFEFDHSLYRPHTLNVLGQRTVNILRIQEFERCVRTRIPKEETVDAVENFKDDNGRISFNIKAGDKVYKCGL